MHVCLLARLVDQVVDELFKQLETRGELKSSGASSRKTPTSTVKTGKSDVGLIVFS